MNAYDLSSNTNRKIVDDLLARTRANNGLAPVDLDQFWRDQKAAQSNPFADDCPQVQFGAICNWECIFDELGIEQDWWRFQHSDKQWAKLPSNYARLWLMIMPEQ